MSKKFSKSMSSYNFRQKDSPSGLENRGSSYIILRTNLSFVRVPTFKKSIYKIQISTFFRIMGSLR
ncbi:hypothetical protein [Leptospira kirschneri]|uniref:hypothetical protein n=1 Tax=Leptospira kirschneri TaxID=29507 RepID=UPI00356AA74F